MDLSGGGVTLRNLSKFNVLLGKNGCGKSTVLKGLDGGLDKNTYGRVRYISPERGGLLNYEPNIEQNIATNPDWMSGERRKNQSRNFRQQSAVLFRMLELLVLREIERDQFLPDYMPRSFDEVLDPINGLLERVRIERNKIKAFNVIDRDTGAEAPTDALSSGESELISLGIECLAFRHDCDPNKPNVLLIDEPDVHLHPDLQNRLARFILEAFRDTNVTVVMATHSTALLAGVATDASAGISFMPRRQLELEFQAITDVDRAILPIFGAHPLSNVFNEAPVLLIEGEDDERVWQQAVRSAAGKIRLYPCVVDGNAHFAEFEAEVNKLISAVYDNARAFSLRDRDTSPEAIDDVGHVSRMRLSCRAAENLMLSDDVLASAGSDWPGIRDAIEAWIANNGGHKFHGEMVCFRDEGFDRKGFDLKNIRNILLGLISNKPWEVLVGQRIANVAKNDGGLDGENGLMAYLGPKACGHLLRLEGPLLPVGTAGDIGAVASDESVAA
jgi:energy-coupling factor transporter ATP-binding protein EcfA2